MRAAVEGRGASPLKLLGVTVLTSFDQQDLTDFGYQRRVPELVELLARKAMESRMDGVVVSPLEARSARAVTGPNAILVTPGVRSPGAAKGDQKRVATPADAIRDGADYVVIGRQITRSADPASTVRQILDEIRPELVETASRL